VNVTSLVFSPIFFNVVEITNLIIQGILDEMIKTKVLDAGLRPMPVLENTNMFENEEFVKMRQSLLQAEIPSAILNTARVR
jgi:hypothetical protein